MFQVHDYVLFGRDVSVYRLGVSRAVSLLSFVHPSLLSFDSCRCRVRETNHNF